LRGDDFDESIESTHGVKIWRKPLRIRVQGRDEIFQINWWDFGGQDIYHGTHALFLRSRAVFLILWTPTLENRDEYTENGIPLRNQPLTYWLDYVRTLAGVESPVIVVQSQCDRLKDRRSPGQRPDGFKFFETCSYSAIGEELGRGTLEAHLRDAIRYLLDRDGRLEIGQGRAEVRRQLYQWRTQDQKRKPQKRRHRTLAVEEFRSLCGEVGNVSWEHALDYFHQTGVVIYQPDLFANIIVLDQDWALDAIYAVFHRGRSAPWIIEAGGRFTREDLALMVWQEHSIEEQRLFLGLMESCGVCFRCGESSRGEPRYIAPDLLPRFEVVANRLYAWKEDPGMPTLRLDYRFFHPAVIRGLMSEVGSRAGNFAEYWKYGLWLKDGHRDAQIIVDFKDTSTNEAPGAGALVLKAHGRDPMGPLRKIREMIFRQRIGERPEEFLTLEGTTVARSALASAIGGQVLDIQGQAVSAAPFVAFFENHNKPAEPEAKEKIMEPTLTPVPLNPDEKPREVYISYAWGDDTPAGQIRGKVVDNLYSALEKDGFRPIRDRDQIRTGDLISQFIERLTRGDWVVTIISDKYLRSPFCMYEIYRLWQKYQEDPQSMSRHVVPIVLPEVKIGRIRERAVYVEHWTDEAEDANEVLGNKKLMPHFSDKSVREARLTQRFADHVDDILHFLKDVLMERKLDVHFEGDFQAVREALRQRMEAEEPGPTGRQSPAQG
jgi:internalin A